MASPASHHHLEPGHGHHHAHDPASPHPAQIAPWSILRMAVLARLGAACLVVAGLWTAIWFALR